MCNIKVADSGENLFPLKDEDLDEGLRLFSQIQTDKHTISTIMEELGERCGRRGTRPALVDEFPQIADGRAVEPSWARHFTALKVHESPFASSHVMTSTYGSGKHGVTHGALRLYSLVHIAVAVAIGLMGAASGRGLAVWIIVLRLSISNLGADRLPGNDFILSLLAIDKCSFYYTTPRASNRLSGDVRAYALPGWSLAAASAIPLLEVTVISAGWFYGAIKAETLRPSGLVGHGMLWLSAITSLALSVRALLGIKQRLQGRMLGIWRMTYKVRYAIGERSLVVPVGKILSSPAFSSSELALIATATRETNVDVFTLESILRHPRFANLLQEFVALEVLRLKYSDDAVVLRGDPSTKVSVRTEYPWIQTSLCVVILMLCCCLSVVYAYYPLPRWVKIVTEIIVTMDVMWFTTLGRATQSGLTHNKDSAMCFMVASLVVSSIWYVGVKDVG